MQGHKIIIQNKHTYAKIVKKSSLAHMDPPKNMKKHTETQHIYVV